MGLTNGLFGNANFTLAQVAFQLVMHRKLKDLKDRGRPRTARAVRQWANSKMIQEIDILVCDAFRRIRKPGDTNSGLIERGRDYLSRVLISELFPRRGRKPKYALLHTYAAPQRSVGRPRKMCSSDERKFLLHVYGIKMGLYAESCKIDYKTSLADLHKEGWVMLDGDYSDEAALQIYQASLQIGAIQNPDIVRANGARKIPALKAALRRARNSHPIRIPKSGG